MCSLKLCTRQMAMSSLWDKCHKVDMNSSKSNSYIWSLVGPAPEGTPSVHSSWWEHRGACAGCCSVESHLFMEGGFVCEWQVATGSCSEGSPSATKIWRMERAGSNCKRTLKYIIKLLGIGPQWVVSHPKWDLPGEVESTVLTNLDHIYIYCKDWIYITKGAHSWYQILYSFIDFTLILQTSKGSRLSWQRLKPFTGPWVYHIYKL